MQMLAHFKNHISIHQPNLSIPGMHLRVFSKHDQQQMDATLTYDKSFNSAHNFQGKLGFSYFRRTNGNIVAAGRGAATDLIPTLNASAEPVSVSLVNGVASANSEQIIFGYFGRVNYDFKRKYLLSFSARYDGASNLGR